MAENQRYIVRCDRSGVFYGEIKSREGKEVVMTNVKNIYYWSGAGSVMHLASDGVSRPSNCKFTVTVPELVLTDAIQIIPCSDKAVKSLDAVKTWKA